MSSKVTLGFVGAFALLAALVFGLERFNVGQPRAQGADSAKQEELAVFQFDDQQVSAFEARSGEKAVRFVRDGDTWKIEGREEPANRVTLSSVLVRMSQLKGTRRIGEGSADLKDFGLVEPKVQAVAEVGDGTTHTLLFGTRSPVGSGVYAKRPDSGEVFLVANQLAGDIERLVNEPTEPPPATPKP